MSVDATFKKTETADRVAIIVTGLYRDSVYYWKIINKRMGFVETLDKLKAILKEIPTIDELVIEDKANGSAIIDTLRYADGVPPIVGVNPLGGKYSRAQAVSPFVATRKCYVPTDWTSEECADVEWDGKSTPTPDRAFIMQHSTFPYAKNDDMVDANTQGLSRVIKLITGEEPKPTRRFVRFSKWYPDMWEDYEQMNSVDQEKFIAMYGAPLEWADD